MGGGNSTSSGNRIHFTANYTNTIDYITCATTGNATDFGDASQASIDSSATSDGVTAVHYLSVIDGVNPNTNSNILDKVTIATTGNATDFGDLGSIGWVNADVGVSNNIRGLFAGGAGYANPWAATNPIHYITIATPGNSTDFGDLTAARYGAPVWVAVLQIEVYGLEVILLLMLLLLTMLLYLPQVMLKILEI